MLPGSPRTRGRAGVDRKTEPPSHLHLRESTELPLPESRVVGCYILLRQNEHQYVIRADFSDENKPRSSLSQKKKKKKKKKKKQQKN
jgi:hypothetical protein